MPRRQTEGARFAKTAEAGEISHGKSNLCNYTAGDRRVVTRNDTTPHSPRLMHCIIYGNRHNCKWNRTIVGNIFARCFQPPVRLVKGPHHDCTIAQVRNPRREVAASKSASSATQTMGFRYCLPFLPAVVPRRRASLRLAFAQPLYNPCVVGTGIQLQQSVKGKRGLFGL
jgi:hypothetical protein